jgi:hypothetical protein
MLGETMALGELVSKLGREKRVSGALWRRCTARGAFYTVSEWELRRQWVEDREEIGGHYVF